MEFDNYGHLFPYKVIETDLETFESVFVSNFENSDRRKMLFQNYLSYIYDFKNQISENFYQWIDGSFVTKNQEPKDIDFITFVNVEVYEKNVLKLADLQGYKLKNEKNLDCYFVKEYPIEHKNYEIITKGDSACWLHQFSKTRVNRNGKSYPKGIIQINF